MDSSVVSRCGLDGAGMAPACGIKVWLVMVRHGFVDAGKEWRQGMDGQ